MRLFLLLLFTNHLIAQKNFYVTTSCDDLILTDIKNCSYQVLCNTGGLALYDITITPDQTIYITNGFSFFRLDKSTCSYNSVAITNVASSGNCFNSLVAIDDRFLLSSTIDGHLYKVDVQNYTVIYVGFIGYVSEGDLTWYDGNLYLASTSDGLIKISLDTQKNNIISVDYIGTMKTIDYSVFGLTTTICSQMIAVDSVNIYSVDPLTAKTSILCNSIFSCNASGSASIYEDLNPINFYELSLPNIFTPNADSINDFFIPILTKGVSVINIQIYNRWGEIMYETTGENFSWDGKTKENKTAPADVYYYLVNTVDICGAKYSKNGFLTLIR